MKRSGFKRPERPARAPIVLAPLERQPNYSGETRPAEPKDRPLRSEAYRRAVAALPCAHCGIEGFSQHAHENDGKGMGLKVDDRKAMPLCCTRPGYEGCHAAFDQYRLVPGGRDAHSEIGRVFASKTRATIIKSGRWPKNLPFLEGESQ